MTSPDPPFAALRHRNFRLFIIGQFVSLCGTWMQVVALGWLVLVLSNSAFKVGLVTTLGALPVLLFTLYGGVVADRVNKRRALMVLQTLFLLEALALGILDATGHITVPWVYALAFFGGLVSAFEIPIRQAYLVELVGKADLMNAIALNSSAFNLARVFGPALAGTIIAAAGTVACFFLNAASFLAVLIGLGMMRPPAEAPAAAPILARLRDGLRYIRSSPWARTLVVLSAVFNIFATSILAILPVFARDVLRTGAGGYGALTAAFGLGAAAGALSIAAVGPRFQREQTALWAGVAVGLALVLLGFARHYPVAWLLLLVGGLAMALTAIMTNTILQTGAPDHLRGQVVGFYAFIVIGMGPFGSLQAGFVAERFGAPATALLGGLVCLTAALVAVRRRLYPASVAAPRPEPHPE